MPRLLFPFFCLLFLFGRAQTNPLNFTVKGFLPFWKGATFTVNVDGHSVYSNVLQNDMLSFSGHTMGVKPGILEIKEGGKSRYLPFFIEPGVIKIRDKGRNRLEVVGTPTNNAYLALIHRFDSLVLSGQNTAPGAVMVSKKALAREYIRANTQSIISLQLLHDYFFLNNAQDDTVYASLYKALDPALQQTAIGVKIGKEVTQSSRAALGVEAARLNLPDSAGKLLPIYNTGEYTLVHFWASWCVPCKKEFPQLSAIQRRFAAQGFAMTGVSLDHNPVPWRRAAQKLPWKQLIDIGSWQGKSATAYGIKVVPMNILLDRQGTIIAKNLSMPALEKKLSELLLPKSF